MKIIKLKLDDINFVKENFPIDILNQYILNSHFEEKSNSWILLLGFKDMEIICDELLNILMAKGVTNGEINNIGKRIDDLIDKFNYYE